MAGRVKLKVGMKWWHTNGETVCGSVCMAPQKKVYSRH